MGRKKKNFKVGEEISFKFAGSIESGSIVKVQGTGKKKRFFTYDGSYTYPVALEDIIQ